MKTLLCTLLIALGASNSALGDPLACSDEAASFLGSPSRSTLATISDAAETQCWAYISSSNERLSRLTSATSHGNRWAAQYLALNLHNLDGGGLEDALRALGVFGEHDMERLLRFAKEGLLSNANIADAIRMLPLSLSDKPRAQKALLDVRRRLVLAVSQPELRAQREVAIQSIDAIAIQIEAAIRSQRE